MLQMTVPAVPYKSTTLKGGGTRCLELPGNPPEGRPAEVTLVVIRNMLALVMMIQIMAGCGPRISSNFYTFPNGFTGPFRIIRQAGAEPCGRKSNGIEVILDNKGEARVNSSDFDQLCSASDDHYQYADGTRIPWRLPNEPTHPGSHHVDPGGVSSETQSVVVNGNPVDKEETWISGTVY